MERKLKALILCIFIALPVFPHSLGITLSYENDVMHGNGYSVGVIGRVGDFDVLFQNSFEDLMFSLEYSDTLDNTFAYDLYSYYWHSLKDEGGFMTLGFSIGQDFFIYRPLYMRYRLGGEFSFSYSDYSPRFHPIAFSPAALFALGLSFERVSAEIYLTGSTFFRRSFQALPIFGTRGEWMVDEQNALSFDFNISIADYLGRFDVSRISFRAVYEYVFLMQA